MTQDLPAGAIFDLDGTLVASEDLYYGTTERMMNEAGRSLDELTPLEKSRIPGRSGLENFRFYVERFGLAGQPEALVAARLERVMARLEAEGVPLVAGARDLVAALHAAGWRLAIGSSSPGRYVRRALEVTGLAPFFQAVVTVDDVARPKPDPELFERARAALDLPAARCLVVEDAHSGILAARAAGMRCLAVRGAYTLDAQYALADRFVEDFRGLGPADVQALLDA